MNRLLGLAVAVLSAAVLSGCGFTPLYAVNGVSAGLSTIQVHVPEGRTAFLLGEDLDDAFGRDRNAAPLYRLDVTLTERNYSRGLTIANTARYFEGQYTAHYKLTEIATGRLLKTGDEAVEISYTAASQPYAGVAAGQDAQERAASEAAQKIRIAVAGYFASKATP